MQSSHIASLDAGAVQGDGQTRQFILLTLFLESVSNFVYCYEVKSAEFKRWLAAQGATFESAKGSHIKVMLNGKTSYLPMHSKELKTGTLQAIKKQLGLK